MMLRSRRFVLVLAGLFTLCAAAWPACGAESAASESEARAALQRWMTASSKASTVTAEFEQLRNLSNVRRPLRKQGRLWMTRDGGGRFRWQVGDPPTLIVVRGADGGMVVLDVPDKEARTWTREALLEREKEGRGQGFASMLEAMHAPSLEEFEQRFKLEDWRVDPANPAWWEFDLSFRDRRTSLVVRKLTLAVNTGDGALRSMTLHMRDGSSMSTVIRSYTLNRPVTEDLFKVDLSGYEVEGGK